MEITDEKTKGKSGICIALSASDDEIERFREYYLNLANNGTEYKGNNTKGQTAYHVDEYNVIWNNCTTKVFESLEATYGRDLPTGLTKCITPYYLFCQMCQAVYNNHPDIKWWTIKLEEGIR